MNAETDPSSGSGRATPRRHALETPLRRFLRTETGGAAIVLAAPLWRWYG